MLFAVPFTISAFAQVTAKGRVIQADRAHGHERFDVTCEWLGARWAAAEMALET